MLILNESNKSHLSYLIPLPDNVFIEICKLASDYLVKGPNMKIYTSASQKLNIEVQTFQKVVESVATLLIDSCKQKVSVATMKEFLEKLGFNEKQSLILCELYSSKQDEITSVLLAASVQLPTFKNLDWRVEGQLGSRALPEEVRTNVLLKLKLDNAGNSEDKTTCLLLNTDPGNLAHITRVLEDALEQATSAHTHRVQRRFNQERASLQ